MSVTSFLFFVFFALSLLIYYIIPKRFRWIGLVVFSICFFVTASLWWTIIYLFASMISVWLCANRIEKAHTEKNEKKAKAALAIGLIINIGMLAVLKYSGFVIGNINLIPNVSIPMPEWIAPMGISFYTISVIGYLLDCYWENTHSQKSLLKTGLFVGYFPILTSGPILRYGEMEKTLYEGHKFDYERVTFGLQRIFWGLFQKLVISARLAVVVDTIYGDPSQYPGMFIWFAAAMFVLQLYTDFCGCMDIIIGVAECYGVKLPENFRTPLFSRSVQEFWQRWHITLGAWMRDFILYPVLRTNTWRKMTKWIKAHWGKKASKQIPNYLGMLCVWLLMGLWHGGAWKYIIGMGLWFWSCIVLSKVLEPAFKKMTDFFRINTECLSWRVLQSLRVFILVCIGNMFFRLDSISTVIQDIRLGMRFNIGSFLSGIKGVFGNQADILAVGFGLTVLFIVSLLKERGSVREQLAKQILVFRWVVYIALIFSVIIMGVYGPGYDAAAFIYEKF